MSPLRPRWESVYVSNHTGVSSPATCVEKLVVPGGWIGSSVAVWLSPLPPLDLLRFLAMFLDPVVTEQFLEAALWNEIEAL